MSITGKDLHAAVYDSGLGPKAFAQLLGVQRQTIHTWIKNGVPSRRTDQVRDLLGAWLPNEDGTPPSPASRRPLLAFSDIDILHELASRLELLAADR